MQQVKTPEELRLLQRAYRYFDRVHAFARDYILERGTDLTDFELGQALQGFGIALLMNDVAADGRPHSAVGIEVTSNYVRAGVASAYPHPNQFFHQKLERGQTMYVNCDLKLGGMGGECYRNYLIGPWTREQERMWEVVAETIQIQEEESKTGAVCSDIAAKIHQHQVDAGMADYIYHRPAHGQGQFFSGHQPPFIALGDYSVLEEDMTFSMERDCTTRPEVSGSIPATTSASPRSVECASPACPSRRNGASWRFSGATAADRNWWNHDRGCRHNRTSWMRTLEIPPTPETHPTFRRSRAPVASRSHRSLGERR
jgi:Xaa-Pro aminopeptidase